MTYLTHKRFAVWLGMLGAMAVYWQGLTGINYYLNLVMFITFSKVGGLFPDIDHHWTSVKEKTAINWVLNKLIRLTGGKHRSWQTHSLDIATGFALLSYFLPNILYKQDIVGIVDKEIMTAMLVGFTLGWLSHLWSDMLTSAGVRVICFAPFKIALVPKKIFSLRFKTGEEWETFVSKFTQVVNVIVGIVALAFPLLINGQAQQIIETFTK